jgi:hypothetical protein
LALSDEKETWLLGWKERRLSWEVIMGWRILLCIFSTSAFAYALYVIPA